MFNQPSVDAPLHPGDQLVIPGNVNASVLHHRAAASNGYTRMPPLSTNLIDTEGVQLLADWIAGEADSLTSYSKWRVAKFGANNPLGLASLDPEGDGMTNLDEYLFLTNPNAGADSPQPDLTVTSGQITLPVSALPGRSVIVEHLSDLSGWEKWNVPGNDGISRNPAVPFSLSAPVVSPRSFFRFSVKENRASPAGSDCWDMSQLSTGRHVGQCKNSDMSEHSTLWRHLGHPHRRSQMKE